MFGTQEKFEIFSADQHQRAVELVDQRFDGRFVEEMTPAWVEQHDEEIQHRREELLRYCQELPR